MIQHDAHFDRTFIVKKNKIWIQNIDWKVLQLFVNISLKEVIC